MEIPNRTPQNSNLNKENDGQPTGFESALIIFGQTHILKMFKGLPVPQLNSIHGNSTWGVERCREALLLLLFLPVGQLNSFGLAEMLVVSSYLMVGQAFWTSIEYHFTITGQKATPLHPPGKSLKPSRHPLLILVQSKKKASNSKLQPSTATSGTRPTRPTLTSATRTFNKFSEFLSDVAPKRDPRKMAIDRAQKGTATQKKTGWMGNKMQLFCD